MRKMKKFISLIAAAAMVVTSVPISALDVHAEEAQTVAVDSTVRLKPSHRHLMTQIVTDLASFRAGVHRFAGGQTALVTVKN